MAQPRKVSVACYKPNRQRHWMCLGTAALIFDMILAMSVGIVNDRGHSQNLDSTNRPGVHPRASVSKPALNAKWQIVLSSPISSTVSSSNLNPNVNVFEIDMFGNDAKTIQTLHSNGKYVICYFSGGSYEPNRPDSALFRSTDKGRVLQNWPGEYWLKLSSPNVRTIMQNRVKLAASKGCDAIDPDNIDGYGNNNGLGLTQQDTIDFIKFLGQEAKNNNMAIGLKNALLVLSALTDSVDFAVNESCIVYDECNYYTDFVKKGKPVFHVEYPAGAGSKKISAKTLSKLCSDPTLGPGSTIIKSTNLDGWGELCDGTLLKTPTG